MIIVSTDKAAHVQLIRELITLYTIASCDVSVKKLLMLVTLLSVLCIIDMWISILNLISHWLQSLPKNGGVIREMQTIFYTLKHFSLNAEISHSLKADVDIYNWNYIVLPKPNNRRLNINMSSHHRVLNMFKIMLWEN